MRRAQCLSTLDWTRYHLWVYFVDGEEPTHARARLCKFFFEKVAFGHGSSTLLYCAAGGLENVNNEEDDLSTISAIPDLTADDMQHLLTPPYAFSARDLTMYDVVVATDEKTYEWLKSEIEIHRSEGLIFDPDQLCLISDFNDAYDVLLRQEIEVTQLQSTRSSLLSPGLMTAEGLEQLKPGEPLRGAPSKVQLGSPLEGLPSSWSELWDEPNNDEVQDLEGRLSAGSLLRSIVGLERSLRGSIPEDMRWWNDEE